MALWIAFDQETTSLLRSTLAQGTKIETLRRGPVDYALAKPGAVIAVLPAQGSNDSGIAVFRPVRAAVAPPTTNRAATRAGGFLGLSDEPVFEEEEEAQEKKGWWRRLWEE